MSKGKARNGPIAALDVGTSKVCCFVARAAADGLHVAGIGHQPSHGLRAGAVVDMPAAEAAISAAVQAAEQMAGETVREVHLGFAAGTPESHAVEVAVALNGHEIGEADLRRVLAQGRAECRPGEREIVHATPVDYAIDGSRGIRDPRGMFGERLGVRIHVVTAQPGPLRNLTGCVARCHLDVAECVVTAYASGLASLVDDERELGATLIDMGGGTTGVAVFADGGVVHTDVVPVGGNHVTNDIARGLSTPLEHAERMKVLYGSAVAGPADERMTIDVRLIGEGDDAGANPVARAELIRIIRPRIEEIFELVRDRLEAAGLGADRGRRIVLTGGASQLNGVRELAAEIFGRQARIGRPQGLHGLAEATGGPAFSTCAGLLHYAFERRSGALHAELDSAPAPGGRLGRVGQWLRDNL